MLLDLSTRALTLCRIFSLHEKLSELESLVPGQDEDPLKDDITDFKICYRRVKDAYQSSQIKVRELEAEIAVLRAKASATSLAIPAGGDDDSISLILTELQENLIYERRMASSIASHDSNLIQELHRQLENLQRRHVTDMKLLSESAMRERRLTRELLEKSNFLDKLTGETGMTRGPITDTKKGNLNVISYVNSAKSCDARVPKEVGEVAEQTDNGEHGTRISCNTYWLPILPEWK